MFSNFRSIHNSHHHLCSKTGDALFIKSSPPESVWIQSGNKQKEIVEHSEWIPSDLHNIVW